MLLFSERISGIIVAGGYDEDDKISNVDFLAGGLGMKQLPNLPHKISTSSMVVHSLVWRIWQFRQVFPIPIGPWHLEEA